MEFGAFVNFFGAKDGLVHISQLAQGRPERVGEVVKEGQEVFVKLLGFDDRGKVRLSMKIVDQATGKEIPRPEGEPEEEFQPRASAAARPRGPSAPPRAELIVGRRPAIKTKGRASGPFLFCGFACVPTGLGRMAGLALFYGHGRQSYFDGVRCLSR